jgi:hypothetical protein
MLGKDKKPMFIEGMLQEELLNSLQIQKDYLNAIAALPSGSLVRKVIGGHPYYVGRLSPNELIKYKEAREFRARYRERLRGIKEQIRFLRKTLRGHTSI